MEYDQGEQNETGGFFDRLRESPRTVSVLIVILIVAAAIYAFSGNDQAPVTEEVAQETAEETTEGTEATEEGGTEEEVATQEPAATVAPVSSEALAEQNRALPAGERSDAGYVETAQAGDGVTHLARRATTRYLSENRPSFELTNEHRIFIEDYIKDNIGSQGLALGEQVTISSALMQEAVAAAGNLTPEQLVNLSQYTSAL